MNEMMGSSGKELKGKLTLDNLHEVMNERMPKLEYHPVGRLRLMTALRNRFGDNFRALPGMDEILSEFDKRADHNVAVQKMKMIKVGGK